MVDQAPESFAALENQRAMRGRYAQRLPYQQPYSTNTGYQNNGARQRDEDKLYNKQPQRQQPEQQKRGFFARLFTKSEAQKRKEAEMRDYRLKLAQEAQAIRRKAYRPAYLAEVKKQAKLKALQDIRRQKGYVQQTAYVQKTILKPQIVNGRRIFVKKKVFVQKTQQVAPRRSTISEIVNGAQRADSILTGGRRQQMPPHGKKPAFLLD